MITSKGTPADFKERLVQWATTTNEFPWFSGSSKDLRRWFEIVETACEDNQVDKSNWAEAGIMFVSGDLKHVMDERRVKYLEKAPERTFWAWEDFKDDIARVVAEGERIQAEVEADPLGAAKDAIAQFRRDHPHIAASASVGLAVGGGIVLIPALGVLALNAIGFTTGGVAAGSLAAALQSIFYGGATTGLFSILQSFGATAVMPAAGAVIASAGAVGTGIVSFLSGASEVMGEDDEEAPPPPYSSQMPGPPERTVPGEK